MVIPSILTHANISLGQRMRVFGQRSTPAVPVLLQVTHGTCTGARVSTGMVISWGIFLAIVWLPGLLTNEVSR